MQRLKCSLKLVRSITNMTQQRMRMLFQSGGEILGVHIQNEQHEESFNHP